MIISGKLYLADFEGNKVASLGDVIITDKVGKTTYGTMTVVTKAEREEYTVTVNAPVEFLTSSTTVYPVIVDPTMTITESEMIGETSDGAVYGCAIDDVAIYQGEDSPGYPTSRIGLYYINEDSMESSYASMLYRLNEDYISYSWPHISMLSQQVSSAKLFIDCWLSSNSESNVNVEIYPYNSPWPYTEYEDEDGNIVYNYNNSYIDYTGNIAFANYNWKTCSSKTISNTTVSTNEFDITDIYKYWLDNSGCVEYGLILLVEGANGEHTNLAYFNVLQSEANASNIYIQVDYTNYRNYYYIHNNKNSNYNINDNGIIHDDETEKNILSTDTSENISVQSISNNYHQCWKLEYIGENDYYIISGANLNQALYCSGSTVSLGANRAISDNRYKWKIVTNSGFVEFVNTYNGLRLAYSETDNTYIFASTASNQTKWNLYKAFNSEDSSSSTDKIAYFLGVPDEYHDHSSVYGNIMPLVPNIYTDEFEIELNKDIDPSDILNNMQKSKIFVFRGHGDVSDNQDKGSSIILTGDSPLTGKIYPSYIYNFSSKEIKKDLSNCEIALFIACHTANGTESLPIAAVNAGAKYAVGFNTTIDCSAANIWTECFFTCYNSGATVYESVNKANQRSGLNAVLITND